MHSVARSTCLQLQTLFSMRLALRGGENAVEETIKRVRGEYQIALFGLILGIELFLNSVPFLMVWKLSPANATIACLIIYPSVVLVLVLYKRSESKFYLDADDESGTNSKVRVLFNSILLFLNHSPFLHSCIYFFVLERSLTFSFSTLLQYTSTLTSSYCICLKRFIRWKGRSCDSSHQ